MKKLISILLAVSALALSTSAFAADMSLATGEGKSTIRNAEKTALADASNGSLPCFRNGDTINFVLTGASNTVTLISSKVDADYSNDTIQYINQYTNSGDLTISYVVRDLAEGTYKIVIKDGENDLVDYFYNVAKPVADIAVNSLGSPIIADDKNGTQTVAVYTQIGAANYTDAGAEVAVELTSSEGKTGTVTLVAADLDVANAEIEGSITSVYAIEVSGLGNNTITGVTATMNE